MFCCLLSACMLALCIHPIPTFSLWFLAFIGERWKSWRVRLRHICWLVVGGGEAAVAATTRQPESGHELLFLMMAFFPGATFKIDLRDAMWRWERSGGEKKREKNELKVFHERKVAAKNRGCDRARNDDSERRRRVIKYLCFYQKVIRTKRNMKSSPCSCAQCESWEWK